MRGGREGERRRGGGGGRGRREREGGEGRTEGGEGGGRGRREREGGGGKDGGGKRGEGREINACTPSSTVDVHSAETTPLLQNVPLAPQTAGGATVIVQQPTPASPKFRDFPVVIIDDKGNQYTTELRYVNGLLTWVAVGISCLVAGIYKYMYIHA